MTYSRRKNDVSGLYYICVDTWCLLHRYPASGTRSYCLRLYHHRSGFIFYLVDPVVCVMA